MAATTSDSALWGALLAMQRHSWEQGVASHAALDAADADLVLALGREAVVRQAPDGRLGHLGDGGLVNCGSLVEAVWVLAAANDEPAEQALDAQQDWLMHGCPRAPSGALLHIEGVQELWVDSVYMVVPALVALREVDEAARQYRLHREALRDPHSGLWAHKFDAKSGSLVRADHWATGNGWVAAGLARALHLVPEGERERRREWEDDAAALLAAVAPFATGEGRFHDVLERSATFEDGTAGAMFAYAAFTGVADGWLPREWVTTASSWLQGTLSRVDAHGLLREVCGAPHFDRQGTSAEAQAMALLARTAARRAGVDPDAGLRR